MVLRIKFLTKRIFWIFPILRINGIMPFCNLIYGTTLVQKRWHGSITIECQMQRHGFDSVSGYYQVVTGWTSD